MVRQPNMTFRKPTPKSIFIFTNLLTAETHTTPHRCDLSQHGCLVGLYTFIYLFIFVKSLLKQHKIWSHFCARYKNVPFFTSDVWRLKFFFFFFLVIIELASNENIMASSSTISSGIGKECEIKHFFLSQSFTGTGQFTPISSDLNGM